MQNECPSVQIKNAIETLTHNPSVKEALETVKTDLPHTIEDQKKLVLIEAPTGHEEKKAAAYAELLKEAGLEDVRIEDNSNVWGVIQGSGNTGKCVILEGHLDTVFSFGNVKGIKVDEQGRIHCPGICDDTRALVANLSVLRALKKAGIVPFHDIVIAGTVCEEGLGGMGGMAALLKQVGKEKEILATLSIDGPTAFVYRINATGMVDYDVNYYGPGAHAWNGYGTPSALHAAARAIAKAADLDPPQLPKTTFTISLIEGGQAIHAVAQHASFKVNVRSNSPEELAKLNAQLEKIFIEAAEEENKRWGRNDITVEISKILDLPAGSQPRGCPMEVLTQEASKALGGDAVFQEGGCTNANMSVEAGIPAVNLGRGGKEFGTHTLEEWFDPEGVEVCEQKSILMLLTIAGVPGVLDPVCMKPKAC